MSVTLIIPTTFRTYTERQSEIELSGNTVKEVVDNLIEKYPEIKRIIIDSNETFEQIYKKADSLMYECKKEGGNVFKFY